MTKQLNNAIVSYDNYDTQWGSGLVAAVDGRIVRIILPGKSNQALLDAIEDEFLGSKLVHGSDDSKQLCDRLERYFSGENVDFPQELVLDHLTEFQRKVMDAARAVPFGETRTYGWLAEQADSPKSARACGQVMAKNMYPIVVPCHRIVAADGQLGGFSSGLGWKIRLLGIEGVNATLERVG